MQIVFFFLALSIIYHLSSTISYAQCPVCIVTVGGGMLIAKKLGIDDLLVSIWISSLNTAIAFWLATKLRSRLLRNPFLLSLFFLALTLAYFQFTDQLGAVRNSLFGIDKILLGQTIGLIAMLIGNFLYFYLKRRNHNHALFPYSKVVIPITIVLLTTLIFKFAFKL